LIHPVLLYGSETWVLAKREKNRFIIFERKVLRTMYGSKLVDGVYRSRFYFKLDSEFHSPNVIDVVYYAGNTIDGAEDLPQRALFRAKPKGRQNKGRP
jgi:hypothetical protein